MEAESEPVCLRQFKPFHEIGAVLHQCITDCDINQIEVLCRGIKTSPGTVQCIGECNLIGMAVANRIRKDNLGRDISVCR